MIPLKKRVDLGDQLREILDSIRSPTQAFLAYGTIEAFNIGLLVLLVGTGNAMPVAIRARVLGKSSFELRAPISLQHLDASRKAPDHGRLQKDGTIVTGQCGPEHDIGLFGVNVDPREGEDVAERHGIYLDDRPSSCRRWDNTSFLILAPFGADHVFLRQNLIDLGDREPDMILPLQEIRDLLPTAIVLADPQLPNQPLDRRRDLESLSGALLGLRMAFEKTREPVSRNPLEPEPNRLSVSPSMRRNLRVTKALLGELKGQREVCECLHVHRLLWTVGYLRKHCGISHIKILPLAQPISARLSLKRPALYAAAHGTGKRR
jgi:hypothetical protein